MYRINKFRAFQYSLVSEQAYPFIIEREGIKSTEMQGDTSKLDSGTRMLCKK